MNLLQKNKLFWGLILLFSVFLVKTAYSGIVGQEFSIATTSANELGVPGAFDGTNYLVGIQGEEEAHMHIAAQLISQTGALVGPRISIERTGGLPFVAFDGTNPSIKQSTIKERTLPSEP